MRVKAPSVHAAAQKAEGELHSANSRTSYRTSSAFSMKRFEGFTSGTSKISVNDSSPVSREVETIPQQAQPFYTVADAREREGEEPQPRVAVVAVSRIR